MSSSPASGSSTPRATRPGHRCILVATDAGDLVLLTGDLLHMPVQVSTSGVGVQP